MTFVTIDSDFYPLYSGHPKQVLMQSVKTLMKCSIMLHFIRVYTVCLWERSGSVGDCLTGDREVVGLNLTALCP